MAMAMAVIPPFRLSPSCSAATSPSSSSIASATATLNRRPAVILPGLGNNSGDYKKLCVTLAEYGVPTVVAAVSRLDWFRNAAGLFDLAYWRGTLRPRPVLDWYLKRVDEAVQEAMELAQGGKLSLIGHSAGGWLARVYMEEPGNANADVSLLLTLGTPHLPPPKGQSGVIDQTRGLLDYVEKHCARAVYTPELRYVCVAGRYIRGSRLTGKADMDANSGATEGINGGQAISELVIAGNKSGSNVAVPNLQTRFVGQGYKQVCGRADVWGDGVVPEVSAHLEGALNISIDGVYHSPVGSDDTTRPWYGSPHIVQQWINHLLD